MAKTTAAPARSGAESVTAQCTGCRKTFNVPDPLPGFSAESYMGVITGVSGRTGPGLPARSNPAMSNSAKSH